MLIRSLNLLARCNSLSKRHNFAFFLQYVIIHLYLVITSCHTNISPTISQSFITVSDHFPIFTHLNLTPTPPPPSPKITFHRTKNNNIINLNNDLASSDLIIHPPTSLPELLDSCDSTLRSVLEKHSPLFTKLSKPRKPNPRYKFRLYLSKRHAELLRYIMDVCWANISPIWS